MENNSGIKEYSEKCELLRFVTAGSVDDGKSTLIGRLLFDIGQIYEDQIEAVRRAERIDGELDYSLFTDGLSAEREQKITIDVAYRYFSSKKRRFIIADVPGHEQYTRNMATGTSTADVALILIDARKGLLPQTKRHLFLATVFGIQHVVVIINKMDLVSFDQVVFEKNKKQCLEFAAKLHISDIQFIPVSALMGDMVVNRGNRMSWYGGRTVMDFLENIEFFGDRNLVDFRLPVQHVLRANQDSRVYAGTIKGGIVRVGERVMVLPSKKTSMIRDIFVCGESRSYAFCSQAVAVTFTDNIDVSRGDVVVRENNIPEISNEIDAMLCWFFEEPLQLGRRYILKHTTQTVFAYVQDIIYQLNVETLRKDQKDNLESNDIGRVRITTQRSVFFDAYRKNKYTGCFILIDELTKSTVAAGVIIGRGQESRVESLAFKKFPKSNAILCFSGQACTEKESIMERTMALLRESGIKVEYLQKSELPLEYLLHTAYLLSKHDIVSVIQTLEEVIPNTEKDENVINIHVSKSYFSKLAALKPYLHICTTDETVDESAKRICGMVGV